jgi:hypothetical protein
MTMISNTSIARALRIAAAALLGATLVGCASVKMPAPTASAATVEKLRAANLAAATAGTFSLAPGKPAEMDSKLANGLRGSSVAAASGSFSQQLKDEIVTALKAANLYDEKAPIVIEGRLTDSKVDAAIGTGTGRLAAQFSVTRGGKRVFDKELAVDAQWESSFVGAIALPAAINQYGALYKTLVAKLFDDADFRAALAR